MDVSTSKRTIASDGKETVQTALAGVQEVEEKDGEQGRPSRDAAAKGGSSESPSPIRAYTQLQVDTLGDCDTAGLAILPLWRVDALADALKLYVNGATGASAGTGSKPERNFAQ